MSVPIFSLSFPSYHRHDLSPSLPAEAGAGIAIASSPTVSGRQGEPFPLFGTFRVPRTETATFQRHLLQAVVVLVRGPLPMTRNVGTNELLFAEDLLEEGDFVRGFFNFDLFHAFNLPRERNRFWVSASILRYVSNVLSVEMRVA